MKKGNKNRSFTVKFLTAFYVIQNIAMVGYLYAYILMSSEINELSLLTIGVNAFFIVVFLNIAMQFILSSNLPKNTFGLLSLLLPSYIFVGYKYFQDQLSIKETIIDFAFIDTASIMATLLLLIILHTIAKKKLELIPSLAEIFLFYPAIATIYYYLHINYLESGSTNFFTFCIPYILIVVVNVFIHFKSVKKELYL